MDISKIAAETDGECGSINGPGSEWLQVFSEKLTQQLRQDRCAYEHSAGVCTKCGWQPNPVGADEEESE